MDATDRTATRLSAAVCGVSLGLALAVVPRDAGGVDQARYAAVEAAIDSAIGAFVDAQPELGDRAAWAIKGLTAAKAGVAAAAAADAQGDARKASRTLRKAGRRVTSVGFRLRSLRARKTVPQETRLALAATIRAIDLDIRTLRKDL